MTSRKRESFEKSLPVKSKIADSWWSVIFGLIARWFSNLSRRRFKTE